MKSIKSNMRCIETTFAEEGHPASAAIKSNMRCIETIRKYSVAEYQKEIKSNMRCIETYQVGCAIAMVSG